MRGRKKSWKENQSGLDFVDLESAEKRGEDE